jgi:hypothetical protein
MFGELAKWVRKKLHRASSIDDFVASLREFLASLNRPYEPMGYVIKMNVILDFKATFA